MGALAAIWDAEDSVQATTSTSYTDISCTTSALVNGKDYFVIVRGSEGADSSSRRAFIQALFGATQIAEGGGEAFGAAGITLSAWAGPQCLGFNKVTGDGSSVLKLQGKTSAGTGRFGAMFLHATPLDSLVSGTDYHSSCTTATTEIVSDATTASWSDVASVTWTFDGAAWAIFGSFEIDCDAFTAGRTSGARMEIDASGTATPNCIQNAEGENAADIRCAAFMTIESLSSGSHGIKLQVISGGTAEVDARRPNLFALRLGAFNQSLTGSYASTRISTSSATYVDLGQLDKTIVPTITAPVLVLYSGNCGQTSANNVALSRVWNQTASTAHCIDSGEGANASGDDLPWFIGHCASLSSSTEFRAQIARSSNNVNNVRYASNDNERLQVLVLELSVPTTGGLDPIMMGAVF